MKRIAIALMILVAAAPVASGQSDEMQQLMLNIEKLAQFKQILSDMKKGYETVSRGYGMVKVLSQGNFNLHKAFLDGLMEVSPAVKKYKKISEIIGYQFQLVQEYKRANTRFRKSRYFSEQELGYLGRVYSNLLKRSLENLDELAMVVTSGKLRMSDDERITAIDRIHKDMEGKLNFLRSFNNNTSLLGLQRAKEHNSVQAMQSIYGIKD